MGLLKCHINATGREYSMILTVCLFQHQVSVWGQNSLLEKFCTKGCSVLNFVLNENLFLLDKISAVGGVLLVLTDGEKLQAPKPIP